MALKVVVVGDFLAALSLQVERLPRPYQTITGHGFQQQGDGRGTRQAVTAARLGADVTFIGCVGKDVNGAVANELFEEEGINSDHLLRHDEAHTGIQLTYIEDKKYMSAVTAGANNRLSGEHVRGASKAIQEADVLITQLAVPMGAVQAALEIAREAKVRAILKPTPFAPLPENVLALPDVVTPNEEELRQLAMHAGRREAPQYQITVCTLGAKGAQWFQKKDGGMMHTGRVVGFPTRAVDVTGAGDVFSAALGVALAEGQELEAAIRFANATAALSTTKYGGVESIPTRTEVNALLEKHPLPTPASENDSAGKNPEQPQDDEHHPGDH